MNLTPPAARPSNYVTDAAVANGHPYVHITSEGQPQTTQVLLSNGTSLGLVQRVEWSLGLNELPRCVIETIASPAELKALMRDTEVRVTSPGRLIWTYYTIRARQCVSRFWRRLTS